MPFISSCEIYTPVHLEYNDLISGLNNLFELARELSK